MSIDIRINEERFKSNFEMASTFGATNGDGLNRPTFSDDHLAVRVWFKELVEKNGLRFKTDEAGNHSGILASASSSGRSLIIGSHLDSVPFGGRFDGNLGVMIALEVAQTIKDHHIELPFDLEVMDFTDEEGTYLPLWGSRAICGKLGEHEVSNAFEDPSLLNKAGIDAKQVLLAKRDEESLAGYMEVHIEQGIRLEDSKTDIGVVSSITGIGRYYVSFLGMANHAGTTPMDKRKDASLGGAAFILACQRILVEEFPGCVCNTGNADFTPTAFNVIPNECKVWLEYRAPDMELMESLEKRLLTEAGQIAETYNLELNLQKVEMVQPVPMTQDVQEAFTEACTDLGYSHKFLTSGAGHDAQSFHGLCSTGMIFIPSVGGYSHSDKEFSHWKDCVQGANTLLHAVLNMANLDI